MPAVKAANVNSLLGLCAPRDFTEKLWESPCPEAARRLMQGTRMGLFLFVFLLHWLCEAGRALCPPAASLSAGVQTDPACCLAQGALAEFYGL